ncbi:MAG: universal stress protein UspA [Roseateles depolymerans]|uniref:Universal stress protein UspA n=1 Tax=Roseateles depolymerans TaxID=76731 RepID=A0A2W5FHE0_9BURK|nr:MAG: universal stress protein UspA [Roseateles depolymerans]
MKVVLAVDGSVYTKHMLAYIAAREELVGKDNEFVALNVTVAVPPHATHFLSHDLLQQYYQDEGEKVLRPVREFSQMQGWKLRERHAVGHPGDTLAEMVNDEKPDLLVMGSHGHGAFLSAVLGSVASRVLAHTKAPVLIVR